MEVELGESGFGSKADRVAVKEPNLIIVMGALLEGTGLRSSQAGLRVRCRKMDVSSILFGDPMVPNIE